MTRDHKQIYDTLRDRADNKRLLAVARLEEKETAEHDKYFAYCAGVQDALEALEALGKAEAHEADEPD